jgi:uncharacterized protein (UPF0335 family)
MLKTDYLDQPTLVDGVNYLWEEPDRRTYHDVTDAELRHALKCRTRRLEIDKQIIALEAELKKLQRDESKVFYDAEGFSYDVRTYVATGRTELI